MTPAPRPATDTAPVGRTLSALAEIPVQEVRKVGDKRAEALSALDITTVLDLITHYPRRYIDRTRQADVAGMRMGEESLVLARVDSVRTRRTRQGRALVELDVDDGTGSLRVTFFNQAWRARQLPVGTEALFFGKLDSYRGKRQFTNPVVDLVGNRTGRIVPIYPTSEKTGIAGWEFGEWVQEALHRAGLLYDPVPERWRAELELMDRTEAFRRHPRAGVLRPERGTGASTPRLRRAPAPAARGGHAPPRARARLDGYPPHGRCRARMSRRPRGRLHRASSRSR